MTKIRISYEEIHRMAADTAVAERVLSAPSSLSEERSYPGGLDSENPEQTRAVAAMGARQAAVRLKAWMHSEINHDDATFYPGWRVRASAARGAETLLRLYLSEYVLFMCSDGARAQYHREAASAYLDDLVCALVGAERRLR